MFRQFQQKFFRMNQYCLEHLGEDLTHEEGYLVNVFNDWMRYANSHFEDMNKHDFQEFLRALDIVKYLI